MPNHRLVGLLALTTVLAILWPSSLVAQGRSVSLSYGAWWHDQTSVHYGFAYDRPLFGPIGLGLGGFYLDDGAAPIDRTQTGAELLVTVGQRSRGWYGLGSVGLGVDHDDGTADASWSAGVGYTFPVLPFFAIGLEGRYRVEDTGVSGFWRLDPLDRRGFSLAGRVVVSGRLRRSRTPRSSGGVPAPPPPPPSLRPVPEVRPVEDGSVPEDVARVASSVVRTALEAMGSPYRWGGSDATGYDCSGLIQWAYGEHGIVLPRMSRDQARQGVQVERRVAVLNPGDILAFSEGGGGVSHVGLYVGDGQFIHSSSGGVRLSGLDASDPEARWWRDRWVAARRILH